MPPLLEALDSGRILLMDGAMGTELQRAGIPLTAPLAAANLTHPECVRAIHRAYVAAGSKVLVTNTFQAHAAALADHSLDERTTDINRAGVKLARSAASPDIFVLGDIGAAKELNRTSLAKILPGLAHADGLLLETWSDSLAFGIVELCRSLLGDQAMPILLSFTYRRQADGALRTLSKEEPAKLAGQARAAGVAALGVNCGCDITMDDVADILRSYRSATDLPLFARPNAGTPRQVDGQWIYPWSPEQLADRLEAVLAAGAVMVGGCCGTTPEHIAALKPVIERWESARHRT
jgi:methionine synthase I (cobalamin-dependent)